MLKTEIGNSRGKFQHAVTNNCYGQLNPRHRPGSPHGLTNLGLQTIVERLHYISYCSALIVFKDRTTKLAFRAKLPVLTTLKVDVWDYYLKDYEDSCVPLFLRYGWPVNYASDQQPYSSTVNHPSAIQYSEHVQHYITTEMTFQAIAGPFETNPLHQPLICSPLQTVLPSVEWSWT